MAYLNRSVAFLKRNLLTVVMLPSIVGVHWMWVVLQNNEVLVRKDERIDLPIVTVSKYFWNKINGNAESTRDSK